MAIYDLSEREVYQLNSIEPHLSYGWQDMLLQILPKMDAEGQKSIAKRILDPRAIYYDREEQNFKYYRAKTFAEMTEEYHLNHPDLQKILIKMQNLIEPTTETIEAYQFALDLEKLLADYDQVELSDELPQIKQQLRTAFLYDVATWMDNTELEVNSNFRRLNQHAVKSYLKEVYLKQQIQGWDFRSWDSFDIQTIDNIPEWIKKEAENRQFIVVETPQYWFLVGQADRPDESPYSFSKFLLEDGDDLGQYVFITHLVVPRCKVGDPKISQFLQNCLSRFYTLDRNISKEIRQFIQDSKDYQNQTLRPILKRPVNQDGTDVEKAIFIQLVDYEKQLSVLILNKLPRMLQLIRESKNDQDYLFYHLKNIIKQLTDSIEDFRLQPITRFSKVAENMYLRLTCYNLLLSKLQDIICNPSLNEEEQTEQATQPLISLKNELEKIDEELEELNEYVAELREYEEAKNSGGLFGRLFTGKAPDFTLEDIQEEAQKIYEQLFIYIIRLEKKQRHLMIYPEYEFYQQADENYRHYAFADGTMGITRLPKLVRLPEDRSQFSVDELRKTINFDISKASMQAMALKH